MKVWKELLQKVIHSLIFTTHLRSARHSEIRTMMRVTPVIIAMLMTVIM